MAHPRGLRPRPTPVSTGYVLAVAATAAWGFVVGSPWPVLLAAAAAVPASLVALPLYYLAYGLLALVTGANPSSSSGSGGSSTPGPGTSDLSGEPATWFTWSTQATGILALALAAAADVLLVRTLVARRRAGDPHARSGLPRQVE